MPIKRLFATHFSQAKGNGRYSLANIKGQSPDSYSVDKIADIKPKPSAVKPMTGKRCDYVVLCMGASAVTGIYLIEGKGGRGPKEREIELQLQGSAEFIAVNLQKGEKFKFLPVLVSGKGAVPSKRSSMRKIKVRLLESEREVKHIKPGMPLEKII